MLHIFQVKICVRGVVGGWRDSDLVEFSPIPANLTK